VLEPHIPPLTGRFVLDDALPFILLRKAQAILRARALIARLDQQAVAERCRAKAAQDRPGNGEVGICAPSNAIALRPCCNWPSLI
jgi:hypothetical protein